MAARAGTRRTRKVVRLDVDRLTPAECHVLAERMRERMASQGLNINQVAERASISRRVVQRLVNKQNNIPEYIVLRALARALNTPLAYLLGIADHVISEEATAFPLIGQAAVGKFRPQLPPSGGALPSHTGQLHVPPTPLNPRLADKPRFAVPILDDQLEGLTPPVSAGQTALVVALSGDDIEIVSGAIYLVYRQHPNGGVETTFRRIIVYHDRYELACVSRDLARNEKEKLVVPRDEFATSQIQIGGLFYATVCQYA